MSGTLIHYIKQHNHFLKLPFDCFITCNVFTATSCTKRDNFNTTFKAVILVAIYIVLCLQNKSFLDKVQKHFGLINCCGKSTKNLAAYRFFLFYHLPDLFFRHNVTFYSIKNCQVQFITLLVFLNTEYLCFSIFNVSTSNFI